MAVSQSNVYKNQRRNETKVLTRESIFVNEYVKTKYKDIYSEAASLYNHINKKYPQKPDLRKSPEFREWKNSVAASNGQPRTHVPRQKDYKYNRTQYRDMKLITETSRKESNQLNGSLTMCLNIPLMTSPRIVAEETVTQQPDQPIDPSTPHQTLLVMQEGDQHTAPSTPQQPDEPMEPSTPQQTLSVTQQCDPSILDQIPPETIEKIINELRNDPHLKDMMDDVEQRIEEEIVGLEVDIPELDDLLEEELQLW